MHLADDAMLRKPRNDWRTANCRHGDADRHSAIEQPIRCREHIAHRLRCCWQVAGRAAAPSQDSAAVSADTMNGPRGLPERRLLDSAGGNIDAALCFDTTPIAELLERGCDFDLDVLPTARRSCRLGPFPWREARPGAVPFPLGRFPPYFSGLHTDLSGHQQRARSKLSNLQ
jgi:hypothetical protein